MADWNPNTQPTYEEEEDGIISQEDCWSVIQAYFDENSLVQTQIASFDEFVQNTIQELVDESPTLTLSSSAGAAGREDEENSEDARRHEIKVSPMVIGD